DPRFGFHLRISVTPDVLTTFQHQHTLIQLAGGAFSDRQSEKSGTHNDQVITCEAHNGEGSWPKTMPRTRVVPSRFTWLHDVSNNPTFRVRLLACFRRSHDE